MADFEITDAAEGDFAPKKGKKAAFESKEKPSDAKVDDSKGNKPKKLDSDYAIRKDEKEPTKLTTDRNLAIDEAATNQAVTEEAASLPVVEYLQSAIAVLGGESATEGEPSSHNKKLHHSLDKAEKAWGRVPQEQAGDLENQSRIPEAHLDEAAIAEAEDALDDADMQISEIMAAMSQLSLIKSEIGDAVDEVTDGMSDLEGQLSDVMALKNEISAQIQAAKSGYPHNIGVLLMQAKQLANTVSNHADDVKKEAEKAYTELKNEIYSEMASPATYNSPERLHDFMHGVYDKEYGREAVDSVLDYYKKQKAGERLAEISKDVDPKLAQSITGAHVKQAAKPEERAITADIAAKEKAQPGITASTTADAGAEIKKIIGNDPELHALFEKRATFNQDNVADQELFARMKAAADIKDPVARKSALTSILTHNNGVQKDRHDGRVGTMMHDSMPEPLKKVWLEEQAKNPDLWHVKKDEYAEIMSKAKNKQPLSTLDHAKLWVFEAQEFAKTRVALEATHSLLYSKDTKAQIVGIDDVVYNYDAAKQRVYDAKTPDERISAYEKSIDIRLKDKTLSDADKATLESSKQTLAERGAGWYAMRDRLAHASTEQLQDPLKFKALLNDAEANKEFYRDVAGNSTANAKRVEAASLEANRERREIRSQIDELSKQYPALKTALIASAGFPTEQIIEAIKDHRAGILDAAQFEQKLKHDLPEALKIGTAIKAMTLGEYAKAHPERVDAINSIVREQTHDQNFDVKKLDLMKPESLKSLVTLDISVFSSQSSIRMNDIASAMEGRGRNEQGFLTLSADQQSDLVKHDMKGLVEAGSFIATTVQMMKSIDKTGFRDGIEAFQSKTINLGVNEQTGEFNANAVTNARLKFLTQNLELVNPNNEHQVAMVRNVLKSFEGKTLEEQAANDKKMFRLLHELGSDDTKVVMSASNELKLQLVPQGSDLTQALLATDMDRVYSDARKTAKEAATKVYEDAFPVPSLAMMNREELRHGHDDNMLPPVDYDKKARKEYDDAYMASLRSAAAKDPAVAKELAPVFQQAEDAAKKVEAETLAVENKKIEAKILSDNNTSAQPKGVDFARGMFSKMQAASAAMREAELKAAAAGQAVKVKIFEISADARKADSDTHYIGFAAGNRAIHEAVEKVARGQTENMEPKVVQLVESLNKSGDSIQRMRFIEELRAEMKQPKVSQAELEILAHSLSQSETAQQALQQLSDPKGVAEAQKAMPSAQVAKQEDAGAASGSTSQTSDGGNSSKTGAILVELKNMSVHDLPRVAQGNTSATVQAAVQAIVASSEYKRIDTEMVSQAARGMMLDPSRSALINAATLHAVLNLPSVDMNNPAKVQQTAALAGLTTEQFKMMSEVKHVAAIAIALTAQIQTDLQAQATQAAARGLPNIAITQAMQPDAIANKVAALLNQQSPERLQAIGAALAADPKSPQAQAKVAELLTHPAISTTPNAVQPQPRIAATEIKAPDAAKELAAHKVTEITSRAADAAKSAPVKIEPAKQEPLVVATAAAPVPGKEAAAKDAALAANNAANGIAASQKIASASHAATSSPVPTTTQPAVAIDGAINKMNVTMVKPDVPVDHSKKQNVASSLTATIELPVAATPAKPTDVTRGLASTPEDARKLAKSVDLGNSQPPNVSAIQDVFSASKSQGDIKKEIIARAPLVEESLEKTKAAALVQKPEKQKINEDGRDEERHSRGTSSSSQIGMIGRQPLSTKEAVTISGNTVAASGQAPVMPRPANTNDERARPAADAAVATEAAKAQPRDKVADATPQVPPARQAQEGNPMLQRVAYVPGDEAPQAPNVPNNKSPKGGRDMSA